MGKRFALLKPFVDVHSLGISELAELLEETGQEVIVYDEKLSRALEEPYKLNNGALIAKWIRENKITDLGFSYRLDPNEGVAIFKSLMHQLEEHDVLSQLENIAFAGLPETCEQINYFFPNVITFQGDESSKETLQKLGINPNMAPDSLASIHPYDIERQKVSGELIPTGDYLSITPINKNYPNIGTKKDTLSNRIKFLATKNLPVVRAHSGPYLQNRQEAISQYVEWCERLAKTGFLDVLSIGSSQLSQSHFGEDWKDMPNGGGVPINSVEDFRRIYNASRPMLVRTYAGTTNIPKLAEIYENEINIAWHALSLFWFNELDGRGPYDVLTNLNQHISTIEYAANTNKPFEANISHHFAFRGSDDTSYVLSALVAAKTAKMLGINEFVLQLMMNTPKKTSGIMDLAKARATIELVRELEDPNFNVYIQSRTGLNYLSHDLEKAKEQLYGSALLIGDITPKKSFPDILHVVSFPEAHHLAQPHEIDESIQLMLYALQNNPRKEYWNPSWDKEIDERKEQLKAQTRELLCLAEQKIPNLYSAQGLSSMFFAGFFPVPQLMNKIESYQNAVNWTTKLRFGKVDLHSQKQPMKFEERIEKLEQNLGMLL